MRLDDLQTYRRNITSQWGEDGVIARLLELFPQVPKSCLEVGAGDGVSLSNTHTLWSRDGWRALLIEAGETRFEGLLQNTRDQTQVRAVKRLIQPRGPDSLDAIAAEQGFDEIGVMSIDIDSNDLDIFEQLQALRPAIIVIEYNHDLPWPIDYRDPPGVIFFRHSLAAVDRAARGKGYRIVACVGPNAILLNEALIPGLAADALPPLPQMLDQEFLAKRALAEGLVRCKFTTLAMGFSRPPTLPLLLMRAYYQGTTALRYATQGIDFGTPVTPELKAYLKRSGLWI